MKLFCDFHIHSCLSPCSDNDMTPGNIVAMASLKGLDAIAITDHQTCGNVKSAIKFGKEFDVIVIPGMELETAEEVHVICLFPSIDDALNFEKIIKQTLPIIKNRSDIFGDELYYDEYDEIEGTEENLLLVASTISYDDIFILVKKNNGICYPAHVDRDSYSALTTFGMLPDNNNCNFIEISSKCDIKNLLSTHPELNKYKFIHSSDAHTLVDIKERSMMVESAQFETDERSIYHIFKALRQ